MKFDTTKQSMAYERLINRIGPDLALYCMCAVFDVAFDADMEFESWDEYCVEKDGASFSDGETDVNVAIMAGMPTKERWEMLWGVGYSENEYKQLDALYRTMTAQLDATGGIDEQQEDTARTCAMMALERNKLIRNADKDSVSMLKQYDQVIRDNLKDSNMRKADILPSAQQRLDGIVDALKKKFGIEMDVTKEQALQAFFEWCRSRHYPQTVDAVEHEMMAIHRTMAINNDMEVPTEMPDQSDFGEYEAEFEKEPNAQEEEAYKYLGIVRGEYHKRGDGE